MEIIKTYFKTCIKIFSYIFIVIITIFIAIWVVNSFKYKDKKNNKEITYYYHIFINNQKLKYWSIKEELTQEINNYIQSVAPTSAVDGLTLLNDCEEYNIDIIFVLAQGTLESHFATKGIGGKINSIFNVCVYDTIKNGNNVKEKFKYSHPNQSVKPYLQLLTNDYLVNGKTEYDLLENYVNKNGKRYASYQNYEKDMISIINRIKNTTKLDSINQEFIKIKTINNF